MHCCRSCCCCSRCCCCRGILLRVRQGLGYTPYLPRSGEDVGNNWMSIGSAYADRLCRNWTSIFGTKPSWGNTTGTTDNARILCCNKVDFSPRWHWDVERWNDFVPFVNNVTLDNNHMDMKWLFYYSWFRSDSYYYMRVYNQGFDCHHNVKGQFVVLDLPEARNWTDYSIEVRVYSNYRQFGILFHYQVWALCAQAMALLLQPLHGTLWCRVCAAGQAESLSLRG